MGEDAATYTVARHDHVVTVRVLEVVPEEQSERFYEDVRLCAVEGPSVARFIIFDTSELDLFDPALVRLGREFLREIDALGIRVIAVTEHPIVRLAISTMQIFARQPIRAVATLDEALQIARSS